MANTPREAPAFLVLGVKKNPDGTCEVKGLDVHPDEATLQAQFIDRVHPVPSFRYHALADSGKQFAVIAIPPIRVGPSIPLRDYGNLLRQWQVYFRRGSRNDVAQPEDLTRILSWFGKGVSALVPYEEGGSAWEALLLEV